MECKDSPSYIQTSLAGAITLKLKRGEFYRDAKLSCLNLLLSYDTGCKARCAYCGLAANRVAPLDGDTFIRVKWPKYEFEEILRQAKRQGDCLKRVCVAMVTHPKALEDCTYLVRRLKEETGLLVSALVTPTMLRNKRQLQELKTSGADSLGIAVDTATQELFERLRGSGVRGPHHWARYWRTVQDAVEVFGSNNVSVHLIVGLGETEAEMVEVIKQVCRLKAVPHLFAFFPEQGSPLAELGQPPIGQYRRIQLARHLIVNGLDHQERMIFNSAGQLGDFGVSIEAALNTGLPFMTSGCRDLQGEAACNRPYGNERPGELLYNYPFRPTPEDIALIRRQLWQGLETEQEQMRPPAEFEAILARAWEARNKSFPPHITFAVPGGRKYDTSVYSNKQENFLSVSITGKACDLLCDHCRGRMLEGMTPALSPEELLALAGRLKGEGAKGLLISGGCDREGRVPIDPFLQAIANIKTMGLQVVIHSGLVSASEAKSIKQAGVDQVLFDVIGDADTIQQVYHLDKTPQDYYRCLEDLLGAGLEVAPHIVIGLHYGQIRGEYQALREIAQAGVTRLVLVALRPLPGSPMAGLQVLNYREITRFVAEARLSCPQTLISFGCARPFGKEKSVLEKALVAAGVNALAYPEEEAVTYAASRGLEFSFVETCCSCV